MRLSQDKSSQVSRQMAEEFACRKVEETEEKLKSFVKKHVQGRLEENNGEVDAKLRQIEKDVLKKSSKEVRASLDQVSSQMSAKKEDINSQMEEVATAVDEERVK